MSFEAWRKSKSVDKKNWLYGWWTFDQCGFWLTILFWVNKIDKILHSPQKKPRSPSMVMTLVFLNGICWQIMRKVLQKKLYFFRKYKGCVIFGNLLRCCCYFRMSREVKTFLKIVNNGFFSNILFVLVKHCYITLNDVIWRNATALQIKTWNL